MKKSRLLGILFALCLLSVSALIIVVIGCTKRVVPPELKAEYTFAEAQAWYTPQLETYNAWFKNVNLETKRKWAKDISPIWVKAGDILKVWEMAVDSGQPFEQTKIDLFLRYKSQLLMALPNLLGGD